LVADALSPPPDAVLIATERLAQSARTRLAESEGPIVPVVVADGRGAYDASRLVVERTLTINTTASGGNASLLSLTEQPA
jgi:delta 1-pyrroline-5-carboxylate dehydrogenase